MVESLLVFGGVAFLGLLVLLAPLLPAGALLWAGAVTVGAGLALGLPTGLAYHVVLYRRLRAAGPVPARWWLRPVALHPRLEPDAFRHVQPWFLAGGLGFAVVVLGLAVGVAGLLAPWLGALR